MAANTAPIYSKTADIQWISGITAANTTADLTSGTTYLAFTADATEGGFVRSIRFKATPAGNTTATVARIWLNNGSSAGTAANNSLIGELTLPAVTASATAATLELEYPINVPLPAGYKIYVTIHTASSNGWTATVFAGKY